MKNKYVKYGILAAVIVLISVASLLFGTHIGKTVTANEVKNIDNEITFKPDDIEGVWIAKYTYVNDDKKYSSTDKDNFTYTNKEKMFDDSKREWTKEGVLGDVKYNSKTRTFDSLFLYGTDDDKATSNSIAVGKDAEYLSTTISEKEYKMIRIPDSPTKDFDKINSGEDLTSYTNSLFNF